MGRIEVPFLFKLDVEFVEQYKAEMMDGGLGLGPAKWKHEIYG